jgi:Na+-transporting methylmalonyl-CoA/oxaloacetate decarboxylase gamma subunit
LHTNVGGPLRNCNRGGKFKAISRHGRGLVRYGLGIEPCRQRRWVGEYGLLPYGPAQVLKDAWEDHQLGMGMVTDVLMYMVSSFTLYGISMIINSMVDSSRSMTVKAEPARTGARKIWSRNRAMQSSIGHGHGYRCSYVHGEFFYTLWYFYNALTSCAGDP